jgi:hypothetical protein
MVTQMADATPFARHKVLKELAGFNYYEDRKQAVLANLKDNSTQEMSLDSIMNDTEKGGFWDEAEKEFMTILWNSDFCFVSCQYFPRSWTDGLPHATWSVGWAGG